MSGRRPSGCSRTRCSLYQQSVESDFCFIAFPSEEAQPSAGRHLHAASAWQSLAFSLQSLSLARQASAGSSKTPRLSRTLHDPSGLSLSHFTLSRVPLRIGVRYTNKSLSLCFRFRYVTYMLPERNLPMCS